MAIILCPTETICHTLLNVFMGLTNPHQGAFSLFGTEICGQSENELNKIRMRIGAVFADGGLISNLKAWENLILPAMYHDRHPNGELVQRGRQMLRSVGYTARLMELPAHLNIYQHKQIGMARAMLMDPDLMIYDSLQHKLELSEKNTLIKVTQTFHQEKNERTSLFLAADTNLPALIPEATIFHLRA